MTNMPNKVRARLQTPVDENGERKDIHLVTSVEEVIVDENTMLNEKINQMEVQISETEPDFDCLWLNVKE